MGTQGAKPKITILDGGISRELVRLGARLEQPEWSALALMESPDLVRRAHAEFIEAGAQVVTTNSYALVPFHIGEERFRAQGRELIALSGRLARQAADASGTGARVAGSLPPIFGSYEPEKFDPARVQDYLSVLVAELAPFVDLWLGETLSLIAEGEAVRQAVDATGKPFWISFTLRDDPETIAAGRAELRSGEAVAEAARWAAGSGAEVLLFNCSQVEVMGGALATAAKALRDGGSNLRLGVYANCFAPLPRDGAANEVLSRVREDMSEAQYARFACDWADSGATVIGGCCGVGVSHIRHLARVLTATA